ncbi:MAG: PrgI family protein [Candidatus Azambacteria bacterium]|nr:PrgI family protein [Candidatus Azambacteria bacterium]
MQYQVPQFVDLEDRIIGPLTLKQFLYLAFAGAFIFVFWFLLNFYVWLIISIPIAAAAAAFAFLKINDRPFVYFFLSFVRYFSKPKLYIFSSKPPELPSVETRERSPLQQNSTSAPGRLTPSKLKELALNLDIGFDRLNNETQ